MLECPLGSTLWCHLKPVMAGSQGFSLGTPQHQHLHLNSGNASNYLCPSGALFTRPPVPEPLKSGYQDHSSRMCGPRESWRQTRPQPASIACMPSFRVEPGSSCGGTCQSHLDVCWAHRLQNWRIAQLCLGGSDSPYF